MTTPDLRQADLDSLRDLCNGTGCRFKVNPITIPPALQCGTGYDICVDCNQVNAVYNNFKAAFPGSIPSYADTSELQQQTNQLFRHYMNDKLGFSKASHAGFSEHARTVGHLEKCSAALNASFPRPSPLGNLMSCGRR